MKIAYVFAYFGRGGAEAHCLILAKNAVQNGHEVVFIISSFSEDGINSLKSAGHEYLLLPINSSFNPISVCRSVKGLTNIIEQKNIDIVHTHMLREQMIAIFAKSVGANFKLIRTFHRLDQFNFKMKPFISSIKKYTDAFISISRSMSQYLNENDISENINLIYNGVDQVLAKDHERALGFIGRLTKEKGVLTFIQANIEMLKNEKMVIAGDGPEFAEIKNLVEQEGLNVVLLGNVSDRVEFFSKISVLVLPSETEVMPMVILEAYSCGLPVAAFSLDSLKEIISADNGILVKYPNYKQLGAVAAGLLDNSGKYYTDNINAYNSKYSSDIMWDATAELYARLLNH